MGRAQTARKSSFQRHKGGAKRDFYTDNDDEDDSGDEEETVSGERGRVRPAVMMVSSSSGPILFTTRGFVKLRVLLLLLFGQKNFNGPPTRRVVSFWVVCIDFD